MPLIRLTPGGFARRCLRRQGDLAVQHGEQWPNGPRWPRDFWDAAELLSWLEGTLETVERQPPESRIYAVEQHG